MKDGVDKKTWNKVLQKMAGKHVIHIAKNPEIKGGEIVWNAENRDVVIMATANFYSMVRRPGCIPYVASNDEIVLITGLKN